MKYFQQETNYTCGVACLRMIISHFSDFTPSEEELISILETNDKIGTHPHKLKEWALANNYSILAGENATLETINSITKEGWVVLLMVSVDVPHWVVYLSNNGNHLFLNDPWYGENQAHTITKFTSENRLYPLMRWKIKNSEFSKYLPEYNFSEIESNKAYLAFKKNGK